jgi:polysaccharide chain length determinant protein (PEP-CTERM system associated)
MAEIFEDPHSEKFDFERYIDLVRRRHVPLLASLLFGWLAVWGASWILPARYKSTTLILVEQPTMPKDYVAPNINDDLQTRLQSITTQILSRTRLLLIIDKLHLYSSEKTRITPDAQIALMRKDIDIELVRDQPNSQISAFRISYSARDPHLAQTVTGELTDLFISENLKTRQQQSEDTTQFLESQLENARASLSDQEAKVRQFQASNAGTLPSQQASNLQILGGLQSQLQDEQNALNTARQQRAYYEALNQHSGGGPVTANGATTASPTAVIDQQLSGLRAKLVDLRSRYTDQYPDVLSVKEQIAKAEQMREAIVSNASRNSETKESGGNSVANSTGDVPDGAAMFQLRGQLQANQLEIQNRERSIADLKARINEYQARLNSEPATEEKLADLTRGYEQSKQSYDELLKKKNDSQMATNMEQMQQGQRFTMLDPPSLPLKPDFPNRIKFCGVGLVLGLALGSLVVGFLEFIDGRLRSEKEIKALLTMGIISEIPEVLTPSDERDIRLKIVTGWAMAAFVFFVILAGSAFSYLHS